VIEHTLWGDVDKVQVAIERLRMFEPPEGYYLAFSRVDNGKEWAIMKLKGGFIMPYRDSEKSKAYHQAYREARREKANAYAAEYRRTHKGKVREQNREWNVAHGDDARERERLEAGIETIECAICHRRFAFLGRHLRKHNMTAEEYAAAYPDAPVLSATLEQARSKAGTSRASYLGYEGQEPDAALFSFLTGCLLGDGSLECKKVNARYAEASSNQPYAEWKYDLLKRYFPTAITRRISSPHPKTGRRYTAWPVRTCAHPLLTEWHAQWYAPKKRIPKDLVLQYLDSFALAVWFFDDGHNAKHGGAYLYTMGFAVDEVEWLADLLRGRFGLQNKVQRNRHGQAMIRIVNGSKAHFLDLISPHVAPGMEYKIKR
jgi:hypothetical protein